MGLLDIFRAEDRSPSYTRYQPRETSFGSFEALLDDFLGNKAGFGVLDVGYGGDGYLKAAYQSVLGLSPARMYAEQPHLRQVVTFLARNLAQLGLHSFVRVGETDRQRDRDSAFAKAVLRPDDDVTEYELKFALVVDWLLYDEAYWWVFSDPFFGGYRLRRIPPAWIEVDDSAGPWGKKAYFVDNGKGKRQKIPAEQILRFPGYNPSRPGHGSPAIASLRQTLVEHLFALEHRNNVWRNGARGSSYIARPLEAKKWSPEARKQFKEDWASIKAGGVGVLEDGMTLERTDFNAKETEFIAGTKLSLSQVAGAFHVNPTMVGILENASYSNVREFRRMLYGDTLGPLISQFEDRFNHVLLPMMGVDSEKHYVEFNIQEKLQGSFEEQTQALQSAVGGPYMTRAEARARMNLPQLDGTDELIVPLNVIEGGQASPRDSGSQNDSITDPVNPPDAF